MESPGQQLENEAPLGDRLSRLSAASLRINESLDFDTVLQGALDSACSLTAARHGVMTLLDDEGQVQDFLSSGLTPEESGRLWLMPEGLRIFQALTNVSEPVRVGRPGGARPGPGLCRVHHPHAGGPGVPLHGGAHVPLGRAGGPLIRSRQGRRSGVQPGRRGSPW